MPEIDAKLYTYIKTLCRQCDKLRRLGDYDRAVSKYYDAITLLPRPTRANKLAPWLFTALGETYWSMCNYTEAGKSFGEAYCCPGCKDNPQIILRLGQCFAECGEEQLAHEYLGRAVELGGEELLEDEDRKYYYILHPEERPVPEPEEVKEAYIVPAVFAELDEEGSAAPQGNFDVVLDVARTYPEEYAQTSADYIDETDTEPELLPAVIDEKTGEAASEDNRNVGKQRSRRPKTAENVSTSAPDAPESDLITVVQEFEDADETLDSTSRGFKNKQTDEQSAKDKPTTGKDAKKPNQKKQPKEKQGFFKRVFGKLFGKKKS